MGGTEIRRLLESFGSIDQAVSARPAELRRAGLADETIDGLHHPDTARIDADLEWLARPGRDLLTWDDPRYPALLRETSGPPPGLWTVGNVDLLWQPQLAVVGSRNPTAGGLENARAFGRALARAGFTLTSGMAAGIDSAAHQAALDVGGGTVAVLGTGPDVVYPAQNRRLAARIAADGVLVSGFPPGTTAHRRHFPARNRIISGLSLGVLVVEAALNSGSLITARLGAEQGREVFALPGSIHNPLAKGCHRLIREGAKLVETDAEILQELAPMAGRLADSLRAELNTPSTAGLESEDDGPKIGDDPEYRKLWDSLGHDPLPMDTIIRSSGLTAKAVSAMLLLLELKGQVEAHPGGAFSRKTRGR
ncbi:DNA-processing protein DprA [Elongatibacter sediminis]|uniref:DNA-processing protein DprA n=1 Tax=Elongatibacter sediminis TaxID=3119006 RepID=A0AAW9RKM6_9GAMM